MKQLIQAALTGVALSALLVSSTALSAPFGPGDWPYPEHDQGQTKYSTLTKITPANVASLKKAWTYDTGDPAGGFRGWEVTPIVIDNVMYFPTARGKIVALNAETGSEIWKVDLTSLGIKGPAAKYGMSYWPGEGKTPPRFVVATEDGYLLQLDVKTGALYKKFGTNGLVNLATGVMEKFGGSYLVNSPAAIYKDIAVITPDGGEQGRYGMPGDPRAFDIKTGKELWRFHIVPTPGEANFGTWGMNGWQDRRGPGTWVPMSIDAQTGTVYIALGQPTDQNFGGTRPGDNLYSSGLLALDAVSGKLKWFRQFTHHDIFDWDVNSAPTLITVHKDGKDIAAVAQPNKAGYLWILDRNTGEPIFGSEERPVPASDTPGEFTSPTQPYPLKPGPISRVAMTREEVSKISPETMKACQAQYDKAVQEGPNTPYQMVPSLVFPSSEGGPGWGGTSFDPEHGIMYINVRDLGTIAVQRPMRSSNMFDSYGKQKIRFEDAQGYPCSAPPWGELMAIDANTADIIWREPLGEYKELTAKGVPQTGTANAGGIVVTKSGLLFVGATADKTFRALDAKTGKELWATELSNNSVDTPMTYLGKSGKQYVAAVISSGLDDFNRPKLASPGTNQITVFTLP